MAAEIAEEREARLEGQRAAQQERLAAETAEEKEARLEGQRADQQKSLAAETCLYAACLYLDLAHSVYFLCDILCLRFSNILMTHATAPRSACTFAQARPTMSYIRLVYYSRHDWLKMWYGLYLQLHYVWLGDCTRQLDLG